MDLVLLENRDRRIHPPHAIFALPEGCSDKRGIGSSLPCRLLARWRGVRNMTAVQSARWTVSLVRKQWRQEERMEQGDRMQPGVNVFELFCEEHRQL